MESVTDPEMLENRLFFKLGLFDEERPDNKHKNVTSAQHRALAQKCAEESTILL